jgi:uncharacterized protein
MIAGIEGEALTREQYRNIEEYMLTCMKDSAHDKEHIYRVLFVALDIAQSETDMDDDVLIAACLLHDIGRDEQRRNPEICHASAGGEMAYRYLTEAGWEEKRARHVKACIETHRYRTDRVPQSLEAKILFDADKIDATGTLGIARTILYRADGVEPLYSVSDGTVSDGSGDTEPSFFQEYKFKLEKLYGKFYTKRAEEIAKERRASAAAFYEVVQK